MLNISLVEEMNKVSADSESWGFGVLGPVRFGLLRDLVYGKMLVGLAEEHGDGWGGLAEVGLGSILLWVQVGSY